MRHYPDRMANARSLVRLLGRAVRGASSRRAGRSAPRGTRGRTTTRGGYPGDFTGAIDPTYSPDLDGEPDPGEIVWTWVPYEEDHTRGKDRPVLVVGRDGAWLLGLMLSTRDHDTDPGPRDELWVDIGSGPWDGARRPSEVRVDRVIRVDAAAVRREGAVLDRDRFEQVAGSLRAAHG